LSWESAALTILAVESRPSVSRWLAEGFSFSRRLAEGGFGLVRARRGHVFVSLTEATAAVYIVVSRGSAVKIGGEDARKSGQEEAVDARSRPVRSGGEVAVSSPSGPGRGQ